MARRRRRQSNPHGSGMGTWLVLAGIGYVAYEYLIKPASTTPTTTTNTTPDPALASATQAAILANQQQIIQSMLSSQIANNPPVSLPIGQQTILAAIGPMNIVLAAIAQNPNEPTIPAAIEQIRTLSPQAADQLQAALNAAKGLPANTPAASTGISGLNGLNPMYSGAWG